MGGQDAAAALSDLNAVPSSAETKVMLPSQDQNGANKELLHTTRQVDHRPLVVELEQSSLDQATKLAAVPAPVLKESGNPGGVFDENSSELEPAKAPTPVKIVEATAEAESLEPEVVVSPASVLDEPVKRIVLDMGEEPDVKGSEDASNESVAVESPSTLKEGPTTFDGGKVDEPVGAAQVELGTIVSEAPEAADEGDMNKLNEVSAAPVSIQQHGVTNTVIDDNAVIDISEQELAVAPTQHDEEQPTAEHETVQHMEPTMAGKSIGSLETGEVQVPEEVTVQSREVTVPTEDNEVSEEVTVQTQDDSFDEKLASAENGELQEDIAEAEVVSQKAFLNDDQSISAVQDVDSAAVKTSEDDLPVEIPSEPVETKGGKVDVVPEVDKTEETSDNEIASAIHENDTSVASQDNVVEAEGHLVDVVLADDGKEEEASRDDRELRQENTDAEVSKMVASDFGDFSNGELRDLHEIASTTNDNESQKPDSVAENIAVELHEPEQHSTQSEQAEALPEQEEHTTKPVGTKMEQEEPEREAKPEQEERITQPVEPKPKKEEETWPEAKPEEEGHITQPVELELEQEITEPKAVDPEPEQEPVELKPEGAKPEEHITQPVEPKPEQENTELEAKPEQEGITQPTEPVEKPEEEKEPEAKPQPITQPVERKPEQENTELEAKPEQEGITQPVDPEATTLEREEHVDPELELEQRLTEPVEKPEIETEPEAKPRPEEHITHPVEPKPEKENTELEAEQEDITRPVDSEETKLEQEEHITQPVDPEPEQLTQLEAKPEHITQPMEPKPENTELEAKSEQDIIQPVNPEETKLEREEHSTQPVDPEPEPEEHITQTTEPAGPEREEHITQPMEPRPELEATPEEDDIPLHIDPEETKLEREDQPVEPNPEQEETEPEVKPPQEKSTAELEQEETEPEAKLEREAELVAEQKETELEPKPQEEEEEEPEREKQLSGLEPKDEVSQIDIIDNESKVLEPAVLDAEKPEADTFVMVEHPTLEDFTVAEVHGDEVKESDKSTEEQDVVPDQMEENPVAERVAVQHANDEKQDGEAPGGEVENAAEGAESFIEVTSRDLEVAVSNVEPEEHTTQPEVEETEPEAKTELKEHITQPEVEETEPEAKPELKEHITQPEVEETEPEAKPELKEHITQPVAEQEPEPKPQKQVKPEPEQLSQVEPNEEDSQVVGDIDIPDNKTEALEPAVLDAEEPEGDTFVMVEPVLDDFTVADDEVKESDKGAKEEDTVPDQVAESFSVSGAERVDVEATLQQDSEVPGEVESTENVPEEAMIKVDHVTSRDLDEDSFAEAKASNVELEPEVQEEHTTQSEQEKTEPEAMHEHITQPVELKPEQHETEPEPTPQQKQVEPEPLEQLSEVKPNEDSQVPGDIETPDNEFEALGPDTFVNVDQHMPEGLIVADDDVKESDKGAEEPDVVPDQVAENVSVAGAEHVSDDMEENPVADVEATLQHANNQKPAVAEEQDSEVPGEVEIAGETESSIEADQVTSRDLDEDSFAESLNVELEPSNQEDTIKKAGKTDPSVEEQEVKEQVVIPDQVAGAEHDIMEENPVAESVDVEATVQYANDEKPAVEEEEDSEVPERTEKVADEAEEEAKPLIEAATSRDLDEVSSAEAETSNVDTNNEVGTVDSSIEEPEQVATGILKLEEQDGKEPVQQVSVLKQEDSADEPEELVPVEPEQVSVASETAFISGQEESVVEAAEDHVAFTEEVLSTENLKDLDEPTSQVDKVVEHSATENDSAEVVDEVGETAEASIPRAIPELREADDGGMQGDEVVEKEEQDLEAGDSVAETQQDKPVATSDHRSGISSDVHVEGPIESQASIETFSGPTAVDDLAPAEHDIESPAAEVTSDLYLEEARDQGELHIAEQVAEHIFRGEEEDEDIPVIGATEKIPTEVADNEQEEAEEECTGEIDAGEQQVSAPGAVSDQTSTAEKTIAEVQIEAAIEDKAEDQPRAVDGDSTVTEEEKAGQGDAEEVEKVQDDSTVMAVESDDQEDAAVEISIPEQVAELVDASSTAIEDETEDQAKPMEGDSMIGGETEQQALQGDEATAEALGIEDQAEDRDINIVEQAKELIQGDEADSNAEATSQKQDDAVISAKVSVEASETVEESTAKLSKPVAELVEGTAGTEDRAGNQVIVVEEDMNTANAVALKTPGQDDAVISSDKSAEFDGQAIEESSTELSTAEEAVEDKAEDQAELLGDVDIGGNDAAANADDAVKSAESDGSGQVSSSTELLIPIAEPMMEASSTTGTQDKARDLDGTVDIPASAEALKTQGQNDAADMSAESDGQAIEESSLPQVAEASSTAAEAKTVKGGEQVEEQALESQVHHTTDLPAEVDVQANEVRDSSKEDLIAEEVPQLEAEEAKAVERDVEVEAAANSGALQDALQDGVVKANEAVEELTREVLIAEQGAEHVVEAAEQDDPKAIEVAEDTIGGEAKQEYGNVDAEQDDVGDVKEFSETLVSISTERVDVIPTMDEVVISDGAAKAAEESQKEVFVEEAIKDEAPVTVADQDDETPLNAQTHTSTEQAIEESIAEWADQTEIQTSGAILADTSIQANEVVKEKVEIADTPIQAAEQVSVVPTCDDELKVEEAEEKLNTAAAHDVVIPEAEESVVAARENEAVGELNIAVQVAEEAIREEAAAESTKEAQEVDIATPTIDNAQTLDEPDVQSTNRGIIIQAHEEPHTTDVGTVNLGEEEVVTVEKVADLEPVDDMRVDQEVAVVLNLDDEGKEPDITEQAAVQVQEGEAEADSSAIAQEVVEQSENREVEEGKENAAVFKSNEEPTAAALPETALTEVADVIPEEKLFEVSEKQAETVLVEHKPEPESNDSAVQLNEEPEVSQKQAETVLAEPETNDSAAQLNEELEVSLKQIETVLAEPETKDSAAQLNEEPAETALAEPETKDSAAQLNEEPEVSQKQAETALAEPETKDSAAQLNEEPEVSQKQAETVLVEPEEPEVSQKQAETVPETKVSQKQAETVLVEPETKHTAAQLNEEPEVSQKQAETVLAEPETNDSAAQLNEEPEVSQKQAEIVPETKDSAAQLNEEPEVSQKQAETVLAEPETNDSAAQLNEKPEVSQKQAETAKTNDSAAQLNEEPEVFQKKAEVTVLAEHKPEPETNDSGVQLNVEPEVLQKQAETVEHKPEPETDDKELEVQAAAGVILDVSAGEPTHKEAEDAVDAQDPAIQHEGNAAKDVEAPAEKANVSVKAEGDAAEMVDETARGITLASGEGTDTAAPANDNGKNTAVLDEVVGKAANDRKQNSSEDEEEEATAAAAETGGVGVGAYVGAAIKSVLTSAMGLVKTTKPSKKKRMKLKKLQMEAEKSHEA